MGGLGEFFGGLGEMLGGLVELGGEGAVHVAAETAAESMSEGEGGDERETVDRYLTGAPRVLNINDI